MSAWTGAVLLSPRLAMAFPARVQGPSTVGGPPSLDISDILKKAASSGKNLEAARLGRAKRSFLEILKQRKQLLPRQPPTAWTGRRWWRRLLRSWWRQQQLETGFLQLSSRRCRPQEELPGSSFSSSSGCCAGIWQQARTDQLFVTLTDRTADTWLAAAGQRQLDSCPTA